MTKFHIVLNFLAAIIFSSSIAFGGDSIEVMSEDIQRFKVLHEKSISLREKSAQIYSQIKVKFDEKIPLNGGELEELSIEIVDIIKVHRELKEMALRLYPTIKNKDADDLIRYKASLFSLAIAFLSIDNYIQTYSIFEKEGKLRRFLNEANPTYGKEKNMLKEYVLDFNNRKFVRYKRKAFNVFYKLTKKGVGESLMGNEDFMYLNDSVASSEYYNLRVNSSLPTKIKNGIKFSFGRTRANIRKVGDFFNKVAQAIVWGGSKFFGNTLGRFQSRRGKLYDSYEIENQLADTLKPLDVLLEKTPFRLTDKFIPGHYGHNAIYIGNKTQLTDLGLWDHPEIVKYHDIIEKEGRLIVEALRPGVQINTIRHFLDIDDLAVMRRREMSDDFIRGGILRTIKQVGKKYDFNFNVETQDTLVCSELIYMVFTNDIFVTEKTFGRWTINPDSVARKSINGSFDLIMLYNDGKEMKGDLSKQMELILESANKKKKK